MLHWIPLERQDQIDELIHLSKNTPCVIYKHSNICGICSVIKLRLEDDWDFRKDEVLPYYLDVIKHRAISTIVAERFSVHHESPQLLLIKNGECTYDDAQLDISVAELKACFHDEF